MKYRFLFLALLLLTGCAPTLKLEQHTGPVTDIAADEFPRIVAILPFGNETQERGSDVMVRQAVANHFSATSYQGMKLSVVDEKLTRFPQVSGKNAVDATPRELAKALGCDGLLFGRITEFRWIYAGVYSQIGVEAELWMVNARTGNELFRLKKGVHYHEGGMPLSPLSAVVTVVSTALNLRDIQRVRMVNELAYEFMKEIPAPVTAVADAAPVIREVLTNAADGPFGRRRLIKVGLQGEPELVASFDIGTFRKGIPLREREPGIYAGEYAVLPGDETRDMPLSVTLARPGGRETIWGNMGEYITIDTQAPPPVQGVRVKGYADRIELKWDGIKNITDLKGYRLIRSDSPLSGYVELAMVEMTEFTDVTAKPGELYYYRVIPVDTAGNEPEVADSIRGALRTVEPRPLAGELKGDTTLDGDYLVGERVIVPRGVTLAITDGSRLLFTPGTGLIVRGALTVRGGESLVEFVPAAEGVWEGITLEVGEVALKRFRLRGAVTGITSRDAEGTLEEGIITGCETGVELAGSSPLMLTNMTLSGSTVGVRLRGSAARLSGSTIIRNGDGVVIETFSGELRDNSIRDNKRNVVSDRSITIGPNWFGSIRRDELGLAPAVVVEFVYDAPLPAGKLLLPVDDPYQRLTAEERQRKGTELVIQAGVYFRQANYGKAATFFDEARRVAPTAEIYYFQGICHEQMKEPERGVALLREGTGKFPQDPLLWKSLGVLLSDQDQPDEARTAFNEALRLSPEDRQARFLRDRLGEEKRRPAAPVPLLTEREALLEDEPVGGVVPKAGPMATGPGIKVLEPDPSKDAQPPLKLEVKFVPHEGRRVDLAGLKVECLKIVTIDLTDRVRPYAKADGIRMNEVVIPSGKHKIRVTIADDQGGITQETFVVKVP